MDTRNYWIGLASKDPVDVAIAGGYTQLNHGRAAPLERMRGGDGFVFYSPRTAYPGGDPLRAFTAIGRICTGSVHQATVSATFRPFRADVDHLPAQPAPINSLIERLSFIRGMPHCGAPFRFGMLRVPEDDFVLIAGAMACSFSDHVDWPAAPQGFRPPIDVV